MKVIDINNTSIYLNMYDNISYSTAIRINEDEYVSISFNKNSTIYNYGDDIEEYEKADVELLLSYNYGYKEFEPVILTTITEQEHSSLMPYCNNLWCIGKYGKYGSGIGEI